MGDNEPGDAVRPIDAVARTAAGRKGVPVPSSIVVQCGDMSERRKRVSVKVKGKISSPFKYQNSSKKAGATASLYIVASIDFRWKELDLERGER